MGYLSRLHGRALAAASAIPLIIGAISLSPGSFTTAYAASQSVGHAVFLGTTAPASGESGAGFIDSVADATSHHDVGHAAAGKGPSLVPPSPKGTAISGSAGGAAGFAGISHRDQRLAGTGPYTNTQFTLEPPDQALCVGNGFVLEGVNDAFVVFSPGGTRLTAVTAYNQFFNRSPAFIRSNPPVFGDFLSDPKCYFDPVARRFFQTILEVDAPANFDGHDRTHVLVAVSATGDPTGAWNLLSFDTSDDGNFGTPAHKVCPCLPDQPLLGGNRDGIFISTNEFELAAPNFGIFNGAQLYAFSRSGLEAAGSGSTPIFVHIDVGPVSTGDPNLPFWGSIQPSTSPRPGSGTELLMSGGPEDIFQNNAPVDNRIAVWSLAGTDTLNTADPDLRLTHRVLTSEVYGLPINFGATQKSGPTPLRDLLNSPNNPFTGKPDTNPLNKLNGNDSRMNQVTFADGKLFGAVNTTVTAPGQPDRIGTAFFVVEAQSEDGGVQAEIASQGYVAVKHENVLFPAIGVNADGKGAMVFTLSGPDFFPSAAFVRFDENGPRGPIHVAAAGVLPDDGFTGYQTFGGNGVARWGDYSAAVATPDGTIWFATEFIPGTRRTLLANWGTFISHVSIED